MMWFVVVFGTAGLHLLTDKRPCSSLAAVSKSALICLSVDSCNS